VSVAVHLIVSRGVGAYGALRGLNLIPASALEKFFANHQDICGGGPFMAGLSGWKLVKSDCGRGRKERV
jgi:hypothetical protein